MNNKTKTGLVMAPDEAAVLKTMERAHESDRLTRNPRAMTDAEARSMRLAAEDGDYRKVKTLKQTDCASYNACLSQAVENDWAGFACTSCRAYALPDQFQRETDWLALRALQTASDIVDETGKVSRVRGAKPGAA